MTWVVRCSLAATFLSALLAAPATTSAQGVFIPSPGSSSAATGPNSINPSAAASDTRNTGAMNPNAAASAVTSPNALNSNATPSTFAPNVTAPNALTPARRTGLTYQPLRRGQARSARAARRARAAQAVARPGPVARENERRARSIVGSVCRGC